jgi:Fe2+ transport system protein FeoA
MQGRGRRVSPGLFPDDDEFTIWDPVAGPGRLFFIKKAVDDQEGISAEGMSIRTTSNKVESMLLVLGVHTHTHIHLLRIRMLASACSTSTTRKH